MNEVQKSIVKLFEDKQIRVIWQEESEEFFFCVNDVIVALTDSENPTNYLKQLRHRDSELSEGWLQIVTPPFGGYGWRTSEDELCHIGGSVPYHTIYSEQEG